MFKVSIVPKFKCIRSCRYISKYEYEILSLHHSKNTERFCRNPLFSENNPIIFKKIKANKH